MNKEPSIKDIKKSLDYIFDWAYFGVCEKTPDYDKTDKEFKQNKKNIIFMFEKLKEVLEK